MRPISLFKVVMCLNTFYSLQMCIDPCVTALAVHGNVFEPSSSAVPGLLPQS